MRYVHVLYLNTKMNPNHATCGILRLIWFSFQHTLVTSYGFSTMERAWREVTAFFREETEIEGERNGEINRDSRLKGGAFRLSLMSPFGSEPRLERWSRLGLGGEAKNNGKQLCISKTLEKKNALKKKRKTIVSWKHRNKNSKGDCSGTRGDIVQSPEVKWNEVHKEVQVVCTVFSKQLGGLPFFFLFFCSVVSVHFKFFLLYKEHKYRHAGTRQLD